MIPTINTQCNYYRMYQTYGIFCYPKTDLIQALRETSDTQLIDKSTKGDARAVRLGRGYYFNGTDNKITFGDHNKTLKEVHLSCSFIGKTSTANQIIYIEGQTSVLRIVQVVITTVSILTVSVWDNTGAYKTLNPITIVNDVRYDIRLDIVNKNIVFIVNNVAYSTTLANDLRLVTSNYQFVGCYISGTDWFFISNILQFSFNKNENQYYFDCEEETGNQCIARNGTIGTIAGTLTGFHVADTRKTYSQANKHRTFNVCNWSNITFE